jgi:hypothetical protein
MPHKWIPVLILLIGFAVLLTPTLPARAQEPTPENDANCVTCHTHEYYLYDSGNYFCLCEAPMHCIYCHGGRTDSAVEDVAHEGLVLYPTRDQAERCQECHPADYMDRVVTFETVAGVSSTPLPIITATAVPAIGSTIEQPPASPLHRLGQLETWRLIGLGGAAIALCAIIIFGYRCYKADCLLKSRS